MGFKGRKGSGLEPGAGFEQYRYVADELIPHGQEEHTPQEHKDRAFHTRRMAGAPGNVELLLEDKSRTRERLLQIEMASAKRSSQAEKAGQYELAQAHRDYGRFCKLVRMNRPVFDELTKPQYKDKPQ